MVVLVMPALEVCVVVLPLSSMTQTLVDQGVTDIVADVVVIVISLGLGAVPAVTVLVLGVGVVLVLGEVVLEVWVGV